MGQYKISKMFSPCPLAKKKKRRKCSHLMLMWPIMSIIPVESVIIEAVLQNHA